MDIRTKMVFAMVSVALGSMLALGVMMYRTVELELRTQTVAQLAGFAEFKVEAVEGIVRGWRDRVSLVASRTQMRASLEEFGRTGSPEAAARIDRILADAIGASPLFLQLWVHDPNGAVVARAGPTADSEPAGFDRLSDAEARSEEGAAYVGVTFPGAGPPRVGYAEVLRYDGEVVGYLHAVLLTREIDDLSENYEGLGESGETLVVARDAAGNPRVLHTLRFPAAGGPDPGLQLDGDGAATRALAGDEVELTRGLIDYRGEPVWAATRFLPELGWGVVVKVDHDEETEPITSVRSAAIRLAVTLAAFAILIGTFLGFRFAQPIHLLAEAADKLGEGQFGTRANLKREDEVGLLANTFDEMAAELEEKVGLLTEFRTFFDVSIDMMCIASVDGYFKRVNGAFVRELGWSMDKLLERPFLSLVHPDDVAATEHEIEKLAEGVPTISFENRFRCTDGSYKRLRWNSFPEADTGRLYAIARVRPHEVEGSPS